MNEFTLFISLALIWIFAIPICAKPIITALADPPAPITKACLFFKSMLKESTKDCFKS